MTDYQPLLARALKGLGSNTSEARQGIYNRARQALLNQLRGANPPLADADITRERVALEDAIRKTETEAVKADPHSVRTSRAPEMPASAPSVESPASSAPRATAATPAPHVSEPAAATPHHAAVPGAPAPAMRSSPPPAGAPRAPAARPAPPRERPAMPANMPKNGARPPAREARTEEGSPPRNGARPMRDPNAPPPPGLARRFERPRPAPAQDAQAEISPDDFVPGARQRPPRGPRSAPARADSGNARARILVAGFIVLLIAVAGLLGYMHRDRVLALLGLGGGASQVADSDKPKSPERIVPSPETKQAPQAAAPPAVDPAVAQRAVLYEENPGGGQQFQNFVGTAVWKTETVTLGAGRAPDLGLRVDIEIPDRHMSVVMKMRRNVDPSFPASHTIEVQFTTPNDPFGGVTELRGMRAKSTETAQGTPIAAVVQKVKEGYFLLALPNIEEDSNLNVLRERDWLDIPLVYSNGRRAVLTFQKGTPGSRVMNEAFLSWGKGG